MLKLFPKTLLLIVSFFLMDGVLVMEDSVLGPFLERRSDFLLIANKNSGEGDSEETDLHKRMKPLKIYLMKPILMKLWTETVR